MRRTLLALAVATAACHSEGELMEEVRVQPGEKYVVEAYGDLGKNAQASLVCRYSRGLRLPPVTRVYTYMPNTAGMFGRDHCPSQLKSD